MVKIATRIEIDEDELVKMIQADMSYSDIAKHYKTTKPTISKFVGKLRKERDDIPVIKTGRKVGTFNNPQQPFMRELYDRIKDLEVE